MKEPNPDCVEDPYDYCLPPGLDDDEEMIDPAGCLGLIGLIVIFIWVLFI